MTSREKRTYSYKSTDIKRYTVGAGKSVSSSSSLADVLSYIEHEQRGQIWSQQFHKASLYKCEDSSGHSAEPFNDGDDLLQYLTMLLIEHSHVNISKVVALDMKEDTFDIEYDVPKYSLHDVLAYSPAVLKGSLSKVEFIIYQLLQCQHYLHSKGATLGKITLKDVYIDDNLWISVCPKLNCEPVAVKRPSGKQKELKAKTTSTERLDDGGLSTVTERWVHGDMSNFDYLSYINSCVGRELGHPNHHPVLPWVMDFSQPLGGWRDLTKSKFRLNKGDDQLDQTYEVAQAILADQQPYGDVHAGVVPHHISDVLSDITYYTYNARRTPKEVLCQHVRQKWVPHEYPSSIKRLQEWTPDECIPEFFTDPNIFISIHDDMPDLELPPWAESADDFIKKHREALESDYVSQNLHHWIDLTFGYKLSGEAAVEARNVCLALVNGHTNYTDHGIVQLFTKPHPERVCVSTKYISARAPDILYKERLPLQLPSVNTTDNQEGFSDSTEFEDLVKSSQSLSTEPIQLPPDFDPTHLLDRIEKNTNTRPLTETCSCHTCPYRSDTLYLGCLMAKIILPDETRLLTDMKSTRLDQLVKQVTSIVIKNKYSVPRALYLLMAAALEVKDKSERRLTSTYNLPPVNSGLLIAPSVLPFPAYFHSLHQIISYHLITDSLCTNGQLSSNDLELRIKERLQLHEKFTSEHGPFLQEEGLVLYLPYAKQLLKLTDGDQCVQAAWYLFGQLSQVLGLRLSVEHLSPPLLSLYERSDISEMRKVKLYHKAFLQQLVMQFGLSHFIESYSSLLVLALCGSSGGIHTSSTKEHTSVKGPAASEETGLDLASILVESLCWLARRLGPLLTAKYFTSRILQTIKDCYCSATAFDEFSGEADVLTSKTCQGDVLLSPAITCLQEIALLFGEQFILLQYIPAIRRVVVSCDTNDLEPSSPASLISCTSLLLHMVPCLTESTLLDLLEVKVIGDILLPLINIVSCPCYAFPLADQSQSGVACRRLFAFRILDLLILVGQRIGYDQTRRFLQRALHAFFAAFDFVHGEEGVWSRHHEGRSVTRGDDYMDIKQSTVDINEFYVGTPVSMSPESTSIPKGVEIWRADVASDVMKELSHVFNAELAHRAYIQCCRLAGSHYIHQLSNDDVIGKLYTQHEQETGKHYKRHVDAPSVSPDVDKSMDELQPSPGNNSSTNWFVPVPKEYSHPDRRSSGTTYESLVGNKLACTPPTADLKNSPAEAAGFLTDAMFKYNAIPDNKLKLSEMESQTQQHLKGDWLAYWEHELGHGLTSSRPFDFKQIGLQCFTGHVGAVRSVQALENENSFVSAGRDRTVRLWTLRNTGSGNTRCTAQFTYSEHKRSVFSASFVSSVKHIASCDGSVHVWDPVTGNQISQYEPGKAAGGVSAVHVLDNPLSTHYLVAATAESTVRFIDLRAARLAHEFQLSTVPSSTLGSTVGIACASNWLAVAHSVGVISTLDIRTGFHLAGWPCKGMEGEVNQVLGYNDKALVTSTTDGLLTLWKYDSHTPLCQTKLSGEQQLYSMRLFNDSVVAAAQGNKISTFEPNIQEAKFHCDMGDKLRTDICKGTLTSIDILPLNRQLLLGTDNGTIHLMA